MSDESFLKFLEKILIEIGGILDNRQQIAPKLNGIFGVLSAGVTVVLLLPSWFSDVVEGIQKIRGKEVALSVDWTLVIALVSLFLYFLICISIVGRDRKGPPEKEAH
jgi:hypothetical protein